MLPLLAAVLLAAQGAALAQTKPGRQSKAVKPNPSTTASTTDAKTDQKPADEESTKPEDKPFKGI